MRREIARQRSRGFKGENNSGEFPMREYELRLEGERGTVDDISQWTELLPPNETT